MRRSLFIYDLIVAYVLIRLIFIRWTSLILFGHRLVFAVMRWRMTAQVSKATVANCVNQAVKNELELYLLGQVVRLYSLIQSLIRTRKKWVDG